MTIDPIFLASRQRSEQITGMLSPFSMAVMDSLLAYQREGGITGDMVEFGVFRGKSAAILAARLTKSETLHLYDVENYPDRDPLANAPGKVSFNVANTSTLSTGDFCCRAVRFCHIDASHMFEPTVHEMALADFMLAPDGILSLDDYTNLDYSQNIAAIFKYLFTKPTDLVMFLVTDEKAYLCRRSKFQDYAGFVLNSLIGKMTERGIDDTCLARTDDTPSYGAFYLRPKKAGETGNFYGESIYRGYYQLRDHQILQEDRHASRALAARSMLRLARRFWRRAPKH